MTGGAANAFVDVNAVIEISEIAESVNFDPLDGFIGAVTFAHGLEISNVVKQNGVAIHAGLSRRDPGNRGGFNAGMTIAAVDAVVSRVMFVAELYGLITNDVLSGEIRSAGYSKDSGEAQTASQNDNE
jgi:hypothetical protein